jgi:hypothetical protein
VVICYIDIPCKHFGGVMVKVLVSNPVDHGFEPQSGQTKDYKIGVCCFCSKHAECRRKGKRLVGLKSGYCVRVGRHGYPQTVVSVR